MALFGKNPNEVAYTGGKKHWADVIKNTGPGELLIWRQPGDLVADFFLGGGTTAAEAAKANRKFIGCDISMKACSITIEKLHKILKSDLLLL